MTGSVFSYLGAATVLLWGAAHLVPTRGVVRSFGEISVDNRRILTMEWVTEGVALLFIGTLVAAVTWVDEGSVVSLTVYGLSACVLLALAIVSLFTGFRVSFLPYRLCPAIFSLSAILILMGAFAG